MICTLCESVYFIVSTSELDCRRIVFVQMMHRKHVIIKVVCHHFFGVRDSAE